MTSPLQPLVSVITPAYNAERFLGRSIRSALAQTYAPLEIVVIDDGSTDGTREAIRAFHDPRIKYLSQPHRGQGAARNLGIRESAGSYITFLDADDVYLPHKVRRQVGFLQEHPERQIVFCDAVHFYSHRPTRLYRKARAGSADTFRSLLRTSFINPNTLMIRADILRSGFLFREDRYYPEEWDLCLHLARAGYRFGHQDEALVIVEIREDSNTAMAIQWTLKRHTLEMFERLFSQMSEQERAAYGADSVLRSCRSKLAWSALVSPDPAGSFEAVAGGLPPAVSSILRGLLRALPAGAVRSSAAGLWRFRQRRSFSRVRDPAVQRAWGQFLAQCE